MTSATRRVLSVVFVLLAVACTQGEPERVTPSPSELPDGTGIGLPRGDQPVKLKPGEFTPDIDHPFLPLKPRTRWVYREIDEEGAELRVVVTATTQTKMIANGVRARVVRDTVYEDGELIEDTFDWFAQDADGNVWYLGEDTAEFSDGKLTTREGSFEAGVDGAMAGILLPARPRPGMAYRQEYYKGHAEDNGEVLSTNEMAQVPFGRFRNALLTKDTNTLEPNVLEYKLYARGVGLVLTLGVSGGAGREELLELNRVSADAGLGPLGSPGR